MSKIKDVVIDDLNKVGGNLISDIPIEVLYKYLLKDYRREQQRNQQLDNQITSLIKRNNYLENEFGNIESRLKKMTEKQLRYSDEFKELHQAISCRNNTIELLRNENEKLKSSHNA